jgi:hypothetical protein
MVNRPATAAQSSAAQSTGLNKLAARSNTGGPPWCTLATRVVRLGVALNSVLTRPHAVGGACAALGRAVLVRRGAALR